MSTLHQNYWIEGTLDKLPLRGQGRSSLKYSNCRVCINLEEKVDPPKRVWISINIMEFFLFTRQTFGSKSHK
jgi:hypothetical protein